MSRVRGVSELETSDALCTTDALDLSTDESYAAGMAAASLRRQESRSERIRRSGGWMQARDRRVAIAVVQGSGT